MHLINKVKGRVKDITTHNDPLQEIIHNMESSDPQRLELIEKDRIIDNIVRRLRYLDNKSLQKHVDALTKEDYKYFYSDLFLQMEKINYLEQQSMQEDAKISLEASKAIEKNNIEESKEHDKLGDQTDEIKRMKEKCNLIENELQKQLKENNELREKLRMTEIALQEEKAERENDGKQFSKKAEASFNMLKDYEVRNAVLTKENSSLKDLTTKLKSSAEEHELDNAALVEQLRINNRKVREVKAKLRKSKIKSQAIRD